MRKEIVSTSLHNTVILNDSCKPWPGPFFAVGPLVLSPSAGGISLSFQSLAIIFLSVAFLWQKMKIRSLLLSSDKASICWHRTHLFQNSTLAWSFLIIKIDWRGYVLEALVFLQVNFTKNKMDLLWKKVAPLAEGPYTELLPHTTILLQIIFSYS